MRRSSFSPRGIVNAGLRISGNPILEDVGQYLRAAIKKHFDGKERKKVDLKYIDPTYMIRAVETNTSDKIYCYILAQGAVHAAFAGFTGVTVGVVNTHAAYFPIDLIVSAPQKVDTKGKLWQRLTSATNQPNFTVDSFCEDGMSAGGECVQ